MDGGFRDRKEPHFGRPAAPKDDLRLTRADRPGYVEPSQGQRKTRREDRIEPHFAPRIIPERAGRPQEAAPAPAPPPAPEPVLPRVQGDEDRPVKKQRTAKTDRKKTPRQKRRRSLLGFLTYWTLVLGLWGAIGVGALFAYHATKLPPIDQIAIPKRPPDVAIYAADGTLIANRGETGGRTVTLGELPPYLPKAFIAIEDHRFYDHMGIDPIGISRALYRNLTRSSGPMQGGSTLTQQLAKNLFLTQERTASRKIQEAILALWLERNFTKDQILELYLNRVYFGSGAYGVEAAAQKYYGKSARSLTLAESAILAGLVQAPSRLAPNRNPAAARARGDLVVAAMAREGFVNDDMAKLALMNPASPVRQAGAGSINYVADYVMDILDDFIGTIDRDLIVQTTIEPAIQNAAERALVDELTAKGDKNNVSQGALVALSPDGALRAMVGGRNYSESQFNRAAIAKRQPGSAFKPFVYLTALERGLTPDSVREDGPINIRGWQPENYSRDYRGPISLKNALALSLNTVAVRVGVEVGPKAVVQTAQRLGIQSKLEANASIALGTSEVTPLELVTAFAPFANGGIGVLPYVITQVKTRETGEILYRRSGGGLGRVIDANAVAMMNQMMRETLLTGTGRKAEIPGWEAAGKTGTSQDFRDAWFVGYTSTLVAGVWLGNDDGSPTKKVSGGNLPTEIWNKFMRAALQGQPPVKLYGLDQGGFWNAIAPSSTPTSAIPPSGVLPPMSSADPNAARAPHTASSGPLVLAPANAPAPPARSDGAIRPPANVGGQSQQNKTIFERLFGG
jgi:penicillin-binding protein 1A